MLTKKISCSVALLLVLGLVGDVQAEEPSKDANREEVTGAQPAPLFESATLPYEGEGSVAVLNNGLLMIEVQDRSIIDVDGWPQRLAHYFAMDTEGLTLAEANGEWFLDANDAVIRQKGLSPRKVSYVSFDDDVVAEFASARETLLSMTGEMCLAFDSEKEAYQLEIRDSEGTNESFRVQFRPAAKSNQGSSEAGGKGSCSCSANCGGEGRSSCTMADCPYHCVCYCDGDRPVCLCQKARPKPVDVSSLITNP
ncbi:MAG: hypothetical protein KJ749_15545 [Planctomycetes bacterium]|nr:hypothetical protein [Planctomycetota bacterium]